MLTDYLSAVSYLLMVSLILAIALLIWRLVNQREEQAKKIRQKEEEALKARRKLHDVRNTLSALISFAEEMEEIADKSGNDELLRMAKAIKAQSRYTGDITRFRIEPVRFDLLDVLFFLGTTFSSKRPDGVKIILEKEEEKFFLYGDLVAAFRIFENLYSNAKRAAEKAGGDILVKVNNKLSLVEISNRFAGAPPGNEIYKMGVTSTSDPEGGIGLSSVMECAKTLNASISHTVNDNTITFVVKFTGFRPSIESYP